MLKQTTEVASVVEEQLSPEIVAHLAPYMATCNEIKIQLGLLEEQFAIEKQRIYNEMKLFDVKKIVIDGLIANEIRGYSSKLDKLKFVELGGSLEVLESATVKKPKKPYLDIRRAGEKKKWEGEE